MAYKNETVVNVGVGGLGAFLLFLLFLGLKLGGVIDWSWWWVTAPIWIPWGITLAVAIIIFIIYLIVLFIRSIRDKKIFGKGK